MRALTLWRPWTDAILYGGKNVENRTWKPPDAIIGERIAIHAGKYYDKHGAIWMQKEELYVPPSNAESPIGIVGVARITGYRYQDRCCSPWAFSDYHWLLDEVAPLSEPIPAPGALGLWWVKGDAERELISRIVDRPQEL